MKSFLSFVAVCAIACSLSACKSSEKSKASPGAMSECKCPAGCMNDGKCDKGCGAACCKTSTASPGAVGEKQAGCCSEAGKADASMGAVGAKKDGCCSDAAKSGASMGAVGEKKEGSCGGCPGAAKTDTSMGAVSEKPACTGVCPVTGKKAS